MGQNATVIGDGGMGTLCAILLSENGHRVTLWSAFSDAAAEIAAERENRRYLPGVALPDDLAVTGRDEEAFAGCDLAVCAVPTQYIRPVWERLRERVPADMPLVSVAKGIENRTLLRPTRILSDVLDGGEAGRPLAALSGPSIAPEVARRLPASVTAAAEDEAFAVRAQALFNRPYFRVYTNTDLAGVELAGATKNVIAIAAGILDGLEAGANAKAALLTRGLVEITRLGVSLGARPETFAGLSGMGDLVTTCVSPVGRNRSFGEAVGAGRGGVEDVLASTRGVVEGVATTASVVELAGRQGVEMPITEAVHRVIFEGENPRDAIDDLMTRPVKPER